MRSLFPLTTLSLQLGLASTLLLLAACSPRLISQSTPLRQLDIAEETISWDDGVSTTFDRGALTVPVNRARDSRETISVEVARFRRAATAPEGVPPIFVVRGGPGYPGIDDELERSTYYRVYIQPFQAISDVIYVGQRGFGTSHDTSCENRERLPVDATDAARDQAMLEGLAQCRQKWEAEGLDLTGFNVQEAAADVADAARALGYDQIQLYGNSFGSHLGMAILRSFPDLVSRATFGGLEGPDHTYDSPDGLLNALTKIARSAESSAALRPQIPEGGLLKAYRALIAQADASPIPVRIADPDAAESSPVQDSITVHLDGDDFRELARGVRRGLAWRYIMPAWPLDILAMLDGDFQAAARRIYRLKTQTGLPNAAFYHLDCASGISPERGAHYRASDAADLIGPVWRDYDLECSAWDADLGNTFRAGFQTDVPALLVHGTWDMNTPFENALDLRSTFLNHRFIPVEGGSHGAILESVEDIDGFENALYHWLATGDWSALPERIELPPLAWEAPE
ncbi:MAG: hypothetical protein Rubg2KO_20820 [Rubricoccaceae bacterium]